jgi:NADPH2:quinone reductase
LVATAGDRPIEVGVAGRYRAPVRAWRVSENGAPADVLSLDGHHAVPEPGPGQVLLRVEMAALNFADDLMIRGRYQVKPSLPFTPGIEVLGRVAGRGAGVTVAGGMRGITMTDPACGGFAEYALAAADDLLEVPESVPDEVAVSLFVTYQTAYVGLHHRAGLRSGETVVVHSGAGGVGSAAIQVAKAAGARVIATAGGPDKVEVCRRLGADVAIDYREGDLVGALKDAAGDHGADVIFDPVGGDVFDASRRCVAWEGRILLVGFSGGRIAEAPTNHILLKNYSVIGVHLGAYREHDPGVLRDAHRELITLYERGLIDPLVHSVLALEQEPDALRMLTDRSTVGKVLIRP